MLKFYDFNAELQENKDIKVSFNLQGINKPEIFVSVFQAGKEIIEGVQSGDNFWNYYDVLLQIVSLIVKAMKKSK